MKEGAQVTENEWNIDTTPRGDAASSDAPPSAHQGRIMVIGFTVIRL